VRIGRIVQALKRATLSLVFRPNEGRRHTEEIEKEVVAAKTTRKDRPSIRASSFSKIMSMMRRIHRMGTPPNTDRSPLMCQLYSEKASALKLTDGIKGLANFT
jgi:hypothetical protein